MKACNSCGKCCIKYGNGRLNASQADIDLWESLRPEISTYVRNGKIWIDPVTGKQVEFCPWLRKETSKTTSQDQYTCAIYFDRPEDCRIYPATVNDMIKDECEMLESRDLLNIKQAQKELEFKFKNT